MRDVIEKVIQAEAEAKTIVAAAEHESEALLLKARADASRQREQDHATVLAEAERLVVESEKEAVTLHQQQIDKFVSELKQSLHLDAVAQQSAVQTVVQTVLGSA